MERGPKHDLEALLGRLAAPEPSIDPQLFSTDDASPLPAPAKPLYLLTVDEADERSVVLIVRTSRDGVTRATIALPQWHELAEGWDGPHTMDVAIPLADSYAHAYGYHGIAIDIESSQLWQAEWGDLVPVGDL